MSYSAERVLSLVTGRSSLLLDFSICRPLSDSEDNEFGRAQRRNADQTNESPVIQIVLGHRRTVAFHEIGLFGFISQQRAVLPFIQQKVFDRAYKA